MVYDNEETTTENDNVLKYIYQLKQHLENMTLFWQGLRKDSKGNLHKIPGIQPLGPDDFIYSQIAALQSVLAPHNFVSQIQKQGEKENIILDTYTSFLESIEKEEFFNWDRFHSASEGVYNTLHLFLNAVEGGFGAQFTIAAQSGITSKIPVNKQEVEQTPFVDVPGIFGFNNSNTPQQPKVEQPQVREDFDDGRDNY